MATAGQRRRSAAGGFRASVPAPRAHPCAGVAAPPPPAPRAPAPWASPSRRDELASRARGVAPGGPRPRRERWAPPAGGFGTSRPTASERGRKGSAARFAFLVFARLRAARRADGARRYSVRPRGCGRSPAARGAGAGPRPGPGPERTGVDSEPERLAPSRAAATSGGATPRRGRRVWARPRAGLPAAPPGPAPKGVPCPEPLPEARGSLWLSSGVSSGCRPARSPARYRPRPGSYQ